MIVSSYKYEMYELYDNILSMNNTKDTKMNTSRLIGSVTVGERGQIVIPAEAREAMSINAGNKLLVFKAPIDGVLIIAKPETFEKLLAHLELNLTNEKKIEKHE